MISITVATDTATPLLRGALKQMPFALSVGLNMTASHVARTQNKAMRERFVIRKPDIVNEGGNAITPRAPLAGTGQRPFYIPPGGAATKTRPVAIVALVPSLSFFAKFEGGGVRWMRDNPIAIPTKRLRPTATATIPLAMSPKNLGIFAIRGPAGEQIFAGKGKHSRTGAKERSKRVFVMRPGRQHVDVPAGGIWYRKGSGAGLPRGADSIDYLYKFVSHVTIPKKLRFVDTARATVSRVWPGAFREAFDHAMATARR